MVGVSHRGEPVTRSVKISRSNSLILTASISLHAPTSLLWRVISGNTIDKLSLFSLHQTTATDVATKLPLWRSTTLSISAAKRRFMITVNCTYLLVHYSYNSVDSLGTSNSHFVFFLLILFLILFTAHNLTQPQEMILGTRVREHLTTSCNFLFEQLFAWRDEEIALGRFELFQSVLWNFRRVCLIETGASDEWE